MPFERPRTRFSYFFLLLIITVGVAAGNLLSNWITATIVRIQLEEAAERASRAVDRELKQFRQMTEQQRRQATDNTNAGIEENRQRRSADPIAAKLRTACAEWSRAEVELKSETARNEASKACALLNQYIDSGSLPSKP